MDIDAAVKLLEEGRLVQLLASVDAGEISVVDAAEAYERWNYRGFRGFVRQLAEVLLAR